MADDQDQAKPKTALIKQKKTDSPDAEKKKVRVVVKRRPKPAPPAKEPAAEPPARQPASAPTGESRVQDEVQAKERPEPVRRPVDSDSPAPKPTERPPAAARPVARRSDDASGLPPRPSPGRRPSGTDDKPRYQRIVPRRTGEGGYRDAAGRPPRSTPQSRGERPAPAPRGRGGSVPSSDSARPPRGGRPAPQGPRQYRPSPGSAPSNRGTDSRPQPGRGPGKRFVKSKRGRESYGKDDALKEREIIFNRKKPQVKANPVPKEIDIMEVVTVSELARKMNLKASELIGKLMGMGMMVTINQQIDAETAEILASEYGANVKIVSLYDETIIDTGKDAAEDLKMRSPIVTVMGHVDHGKTKLLDAIRSTDVVAGEHGGITQHIGAYQVNVKQGTITFLDTPGHEAFTLMRARGANITDIVVLVVAANDGVMPQTQEAISHAKDAGVPIIVAINKTDLPEANIDRVKQQLSDAGLVPEDWGGDVAMLPVSALKGDGVPDLLESVLVQAEVMELKASFDRTAEGKVIESRIDPGRGTVATVLVQRGTLNVGDSFVAGIYPGKVRAMFDDRGRRVESAGPSAPVEVIGLDGVPEAGDPFQVTEDDRSARTVGSKRQELKRVEEAKNVKKITLDNLYDSIQDGEVQELKVVIKGDVHGSVEALKHALEKLSTSEVRLSAIHSAAGAINEGDVMLAGASNALVVGFHVRPTPRAVAVADREKVEIRKYNVIYDAVEDIRAAMEGLLAPDLQEETIGSAEVRELFKVPKIGIIAGSYVLDGQIRRNANVRVFRDSVEVYTGKITSLKRFKDDARQVEAGYECGIGVGFQDLQVGDTLEAYVVTEVAKKL